MRQALPKGLVRQNIYLPGREEVGFDLMREHTEASSDSEVVRQALRHLEQYVNDARHGMKLKIHDPTVPVRPEWTLNFDFEILKPYSPTTTRRSLILHERSMQRLKRLTEAFRPHDFSWVVVRALQFYRYIIDLQIRGGKLFAVMPNGEELHVRF